MDVMKVPTFDEWYVATHGGTLEEQYMIDGQEIHIAMRELARAMRDYISHIAQTHASKVYAEEWIAGPSGEPVFIVTTDGKPT